jgi:hypothetical protein
MQNWFIIFQFFDVQYAISWALDKQIKVTARLTYILLHCSELSQHYFLFFLSFTNSAQTQTLEVRMLKEQLYCSASRFLVNFAVHSLTPQLVEIYFEEFLVMKNRVEQGTSRENL